MKIFLCLLMASLLALATCQTLQQVECINNLLLERRTDITDKCRSSVPTLGSVCNNDCQRAVGRIYSDCDVSDDLNPCSGAVKIYALPMLMVIMLAAVFST